MLIPPVQRLLTKSLNVAPSSERRCTSEKWANRMAAWVYNIKMPDGPTRRHVQHPRRRHGTAVRRAVTAAVREHFDARGFVETPTPIAVPSPGMEPHIRPFRVLPAGAD